MKGAARAALDEDEEFVDFDCPGCSFLATVGLVVAAGEGGRLSDIGRIEAAVCSEVWAGLEAIGEGHI